MDNIFLARIGEMDAMRCISVIRKEEDAVMLMSNAIGRRIRAKPKEFSICERLF